MSYIRIKNQNQKGEGHGPPSLYRLCTCFCPFDFDTFKTLRGYLVSVFKQQFSIFKQYFTYFYTFFHLHVFPQKFLNNNFQVLNTCTKRALNGFCFCFCFPSG